LKRNKDIAEILLKGGALITSADDHGWTPALCAVMLQDSDIKTMIERYHLGELPNIPNDLLGPDGWSELHKHPRIQLENRLDAICGRCSPHQLWFN
jgi:hypothetical protein